MTYETNASVSMVTGASMKIKRTVSSRNDSNNLIDLDQAVREIHRYNHMQQPLIQQALRDGSTILASGHYYYRQPSILDMLNEDNNFDKLMEIIIKKFGDQGSCENVEDLILDSDSDRREILQEVFAFADEVLGL
jgi:hypothetical protein